MAWTLQGQYMETCNCTFICPCISSNLAANPTEGDCKAALAMRIDKGLKDVSENIRVTSIVGRYLEHSRIYYFMNGGKEEVYLGSADLMPRNLDRRVEVLFPIQDEAMVHHIHDDILNTYLNDNSKSRRMNSDGIYERVKAEGKEQSENSQAWFIKQRDHFS